MLGSSHIAIALAQIQENDNFEMLCSKLPQEEANELRVARAERQADALEHRRKIEIAEAGKSEISVNNYFL